MWNKLTLEQKLRVRDLFEQIVDLPASQRRDFLTESCADDALVRQELESLLQQAESGNSQCEDLLQNVIRPALVNLKNDPDKLGVWLDHVASPTVGATDGLTGTTISHFEILEPIGSGGMGIVYKARDRILERIVALKFLPPAYTHDQSRKDRFIHEARAASALDHQNIASVHEIGETAEHKWFIAMGYYPGKTLNEIIASGPVDPDVALDYAVQLASGLAAAHAHNIIHRDVKPGNIIITEEGTVKLLDFGLAKLTDIACHTQSGQMLGTFAYMAPEILQGKAADKRSDIWSMGVVLYELLTGSRPFDGDSLQSVLQAILQKAPRNPRKVLPDESAELISIVGSCLTKNPDKRYQSVDQLLNDLRRVQDGGRPGKRSGQRTWSQPWRRYSHILTSAIVALLAFLFAWGWNNHSPRTDQPAAGVPAINKIAVLPFHNLNNDPSQDYFVDGIHDGTITSLAKIASLEIISRNSTLHFRNSDLPVPEIAKVLGAEAILLGSVLRSGDRVRVSAQLINAATDEHIWAESYDREISAASVLGIQSEITHDIAMALQAVLMPFEDQQIQKLPTRNLAALEAYYQGRAARFHGKRAGRMDAVKHFKYAIKLDPLFARAYAELARVYELQIWKDGFPPQKQLALAKAMIDKALELDDKESTAYVALGQYQWDHDNDFIGAKASLDHAIELNPADGDARIVLGGLMLLTGAPDRLDYFQKAVELQPDLYSKLDLAYSLRVSGNSDEAEKILRDELQRDHGNTRAIAILGDLYQYNHDRFDEAMVWFRKAHFLEPDDPFPPAWISQLYFQMGDLEASSKWAERSLAIAPESWMSEFLRMRIHIFKDQLDLAPDDFALLSMSKSYYTPDILQPLIQAQLKSGRSKQALELCKAFCPQFLDLQDSGGESGYARPVRDPVGSRRNTVLAIDPGMPIVEADWIANQAHHVKAIYPLPPAAVIDERSPGSGKSTLYFKVNRPSIVGVPGKIDIVWGLAGIGELADAGDLTYADYSVQGRYTRDGFMDIRDGEKYVHLSTTPLETDTFHELWFVIDFNLQTYDLHIRGGERFPQQTVLYRGAKFRQQGSYPLDHFLITSTTGGFKFNRRGEDPAYFDDICIDPTGENLAFPGPDWIVIDNFEDGDVSDWQVFNIRGYGIFEFYLLGMAFDVSQVLRACGKSGQADKLVEALHAAVRSFWSNPSFHWYAYVGARIHALHGNRDQMIRSMRNLIDYNTIRKGMFDGDEFNPYRDDPEFKQLVARADAKMDAQLARVRDMEARGDLAPIPDISGISGW